MNKTIQLGMWIARVGGWQPTQTESLIQLADELRGILRDELPATVEQVVHKKLDSLYTEEMNRAISEKAKWATKAQVWPSDTVVERARVLAAEVDLPGFSGEYKRHQVLAKLIKEYPGEPKRALAMAIELALWQ